MRRHHGHHCVIERYRGPMKKEFEKTENICSIYTGQAVLYSPIDLMVRLNPVFSWDINREVGLS